MGWFQPTESAPRVFEALVLAAAESFGLGDRVLHLAFADPYEPPERSRRSAPDAVAQRLGPLIHQIDRASSPEAIPFPEESADVVVWQGWPQRDWETGRWADAILRRLLPGGLWLALATARKTAGGSLRLPPSPVAIERGLGDAPAHVIAWQGDDPCPHTVFLVAFKSPATRLSLASFDRFTDRLRAHIADVPGGLWRRIGSRLRRWCPFAGVGRAADVRLAVHFASRIAPHVEATAAGPLLDARRRAPGRCR